MHAPKRWRQRAFYGLPGSAARRMQLSWGLLTFIAHTERQTNLGDAGNSPVFVRRMIFIK
jgi:hypothetical protein